ncbi:hypothetical protein K1X76_07055 [bacterium]|nr:hypothetical protein [bacterium]
MNPIEKTRWEETRNRGLMFFIIKRGFVWFGFPGAFLYTFVTSKQLNLPTMDVLPRAVAMFNFAGFFFALFLWFVMERRYKKTANLS